MKSSITGKLVTGLMAIFLSVTAMAENPNSITLIDSSSFGIDATEIQEFREKMQTAVDGDFISGAILLVDNDKGIGVLETRALMTILP